MVKQKKISVVSPVYNSSKILDIFIKTLVQSLLKITKNYEIILIDDNSTDNSWRVLIDLQNKHKNLVIKKNKKNIGQHPTIRKGLKLSKGKLIFILDCDLQDNPKYFKKFFDSHQKDKKATIGLMDDKSFYKKRSISKFFWNILNFFSKYYFPNNITNFTLISSKQLKRLLKIEKIGFLYGDICKSNIKVKFLSIKRNKRYLGKSSYNFFKVFKLAIFWIWFYTFESILKNKKYEKKN